MPQFTGKLTMTEEKIEQVLRSRFSEEQMCAYFLPMTIRSWYQFDDEFVAGCYEKIFGKKPEQNQQISCELIKAYTEMLMFKNKYRFHLDYWTRKYQQKLITEMESFFVSIYQDINDWA